MDSPIFLDKQEKLHFEQSWLDYKLSGSIDWNTFRSTHKLHLAEKKTLVVWDFIDGAPRVHSILRLQEVKLGFGSGLTLGLEADDSTRYSVTATPQQLLPGVFLWTPAFCDIRFAPMRYDTPDSTYRLTLPMMCKTRSRADRPQEGHRYILTMGEFAKQWPNT